MFDESAYRQQLVPALEPQVRALLQAGHTLTVRWDCGGDESFVYTAIDGVEQAFDYKNDKKNLAVLLDDYLTCLLELPSAGEFAMKGTGRIFQEGAAVLIEYQSRATVYWEDYGLTDEELRKLGVELPEHPAPLAESETTPLTTAATEADAAGAEEGGEEEQAGTFDQDMSDEYSGRRALFTLP